MGACFLQNSNTVAFTSRRLTNTECRYAMIAKEMVSIVHATEAFHYFIFGKSAVVYNDYKPLEELFKKPLPSSPLRLQHMLLKLQWYDLEVKYSVE